MRYAASLVCVLFVLAQTGFTKEQVRELTWEDLIPKSNTLFKFSDKTETPIDHSSNEPQTSLPRSPSSTAVVEELNGKRVKIPAFIVPLDGDQNTLTELLLVPYFGACIHVPPPPPNQLIYSENTDGISVKKIDLYEPVWATGIIKTEATQNELAEVGYVMEIEELEKYEWE